MKKILHGADYNPEQWLNHPGVIDEDFRLLPLARLNAITIGIFSWAALEPEEGVYDFSWMDDIFARAEKAGLQVVLATPTGGKPNWMARRYPEIRRVSPNGLRDPQQRRHNHCLTSPVYREKTAAINTRLAERYGRHPSLVLWHVSNEYRGYCHCNLCLGAFQTWLKARYQTLDALNEAWWARFWSHTYTEWEQINFIDDTVNGLALDWRRFMTHQCGDFMRNEIAPLRAHAPGIPVTTNFMGLFYEYNYWELARDLDLVCWDSYPAWHLGGSADESQTGLGTAFTHDVYRAFKGGKPFLLMETTPSQTNNGPVSPLRRPGVHRLNGVQALAHGADGVSYFQFRKGRGSMEQHHGAVVDHAGHEHTRVFRDVAALGDCLEKLSGVLGARTVAKVAVIFDWENWWALDGAFSPRNENKKYPDTVTEFYRPLRELGVAVDVVDSTASLDPYTLVLAPMLYLLRPGQAQQLTTFVERGGTLVTTYQSGLVNETCLCFQDAVPGPLQAVLGLWVEEFEAAPNGVSHSVIASGSSHGLSGTYQARDYLDLLNVTTAEVLATYGDDFFTGRPALTVNRFGQGHAYYVASRNEARFQDDLLRFLVAELALPRALTHDLSPGVTAHVRSIEDRNYLFLLNFRNDPASVQLDPGPWLNAETGDSVGPVVSLSPFGSLVLQTSA